MEIHIIAAVARNNVIGRNGALPWHIPADLKHFRRLTTGHTVVMGRRTYESIGRPLPNRRCIIVSTTMAAAPEGVEVVKSLQSALAMSSQGHRFIIGGARLYAEALAYADFLHLTKVAAEVEGDAFFPEVDWSDWVLQEEVRSIDETAGLGLAFCTYSRKGPRRTL